MNGTSDPRARADAVLAAALELPPGRRTAFLDEACAGNPDLHADVLQLLRWTTQEASRCDECAAAVSKVWEALAVESDQEDAGDLDLRVDGWRLVREIGRGGMGTVYLAERDDHAFAGRAAIKLLRRGIDTEDVVRRFEQERQILADLDHPAIGRLLDGGRTPDGRPYLVMELVEGEPIDRHCDTQRLSVIERLRLFVQVARAVAHAHQKLVVHRDLKPAHIIVSPGGAVKLLDFGIAKILDSSAGEGVTATRGRFMTLECASPEQVAGLPITTASDVYQLGLLLYLLLTGRYAYDVRTTPAATLERVICEVDPLLPSTAVRRTRPAAGSSGDDDGPDERAARRAATPARLARLLRGDLDAIVLKALEKNAARRYPTVDRLIEDVERHLQGLPVLARRTTAAYRLRKFVRRNRIGVSAAAVVVLSLLAGLAGTAWQARVAAEEARKAREVRDFLVDLFAVSHPDRVAGATITAREILDRGAERIRVELERDPVARAELLGTIGDIYRRLALFERAAPLLDESLAIRRARYGSAHPDVAESLERKAALHSDQGEYTAAETLFREALSIRRQTLGATHVTVAVALSGLQRPLRAQSRHEEAEPLAREALEIYLAAYGPDDVRVATAQNNLAQLLHQRGDLDGAEQLYRAALATHRKHHGDVHSHVASTLHNLATLTAKHGDLDEAERLYSEVLEIERAIYPDGHPTTAATLGYLGHVRRERGDVRGAERAYRDSIDLLQRSHGVGHASTAGALWTLGRLLLTAGRTADAEAPLRECLEIRGRTLGPDHVRTLEAQTALGSALAALDRREEAARLLNEAVERASARHGDTHDVTIQARRARAGM